MNNHQDQKNAAGYVYDPIYLQHDTGTHVENAGRLQAILAGLDRTGIKPLLVQIPARAATMAELMLVHKESYIHSIETFCRNGGGWWDQDTLMSPGSYEAAVYAAGGGIKAVEAVAKGMVEHVFALVRPPGHHATADQCMGFCLFNNVAIAANYALKYLAIKKIIILDFDVHHGNGTQEAFSHNPNVLYISLHQYPLFPGTGRIDDTGDHRTNGGTSINIPMPAGCRDIEYVRVFNEIVIPAVRRFAPDLLLVSAGYDGHWADSISHMRLSLDGFVTLTRIIESMARECCGGKTVYFLEGGYNYRVLEVAVNNTLKIWLRENFLADPLGPPPNDIAPSNIDDVIDAVKIKHGIL